MAAYSLLKEELRPLRSFQMGSMQAPAPEVPRLALGSARLILRHLQRRTESSHLRLMTMGGPLTKSTMSPMSSKPPNASVMVQPSLAAVAMKAAAGPLQTLHGLWALVSLTLASAARINSSPLLSQPSQMAVAKW